MIYLDYSATAPVLPEVTDGIREVLEEDFGNPSSLYDLGIRSEKRIAAARKKVARSLGVKAPTIVFTSCGSESNNMVIRGVAKKMKNRGNHMICSAVEHPSVLRTMEAISDEYGFSLTKIGVDKKGNPDLDQLKAAMTGDTVICAMMMVNNEVGSVFPLKEIGEIVHGINPECVFHVDGVQGYGRIPLDVKKTGIDTFSLSGHKIGAPKGIGALYIREGLNIPPLIYGGGQEMGLRSGTENTPYIHGLGLAVDNTFKNRDAKNRYLYNLKLSLLKELDNLGVEYSVNGDINKGAAHILNLRFPGIKSEVLLHYSEGQEIYVSQGSACHNNTKSGSETLAAMGLDVRARDESLRFSFGDALTTEQMVITAGVIKSGVDMIKGMRKKK